MVYRLVRGERKLFSEAISGDRFPKVIYNNGSRTIARDAAEFVFVVAEPGDTVVEPFETPFVTVSETDYDLVLGRDFDTCVFIMSNGNLVIKESVPPPVLSGELNIDGNAELEWEGSFETKSKIYRTTPYLTGDDYSEFILIAEIDGTNIPGATSSYTDDSVAPDPTQSVSYLIVNQNGTSNTITLDGA